MKKIISLFIILILLCGCGLNEEAKSPDETENMADDWGITFSVRGATFTGATVVFTQSGGNPTGELMTGSYYRIENANGELAYTVEGDIAWTAEAYMIKKDGETTMDVSWEWLYGELEPGTYKIIKSVSDFRGPGDSDDKTYFAEFVIE